MHVDRTILLQFQDKERACGFRIERWFFAADRREESAARVAAVWVNLDTHDEYVVLLDSKSVRSVIEELSPFT